MDSLKFIEDLSRHAVVRNDMDICMQLGFPLLQKKGDILLVSFKAHKQASHNGAMEYYEPVYEITWAYPSGKLVYFKDLYLESDRDFKKPLHTIDGKILSSKAKYLYNEIYDECTRCFDFWDKNGTLSDLTVKKYNSMLQQNIKQLGLDCIYFK